MGEIRGTLVTGAEIRDIRVVAAPGRPEIRWAAVARVRASWSLPALLLGSDTWLETLKIEGVRGVIDLGASPPPPRERRPSSGGGPTILPASVRLRGLDLTLIHGDDRVELAGFSVEADRQDGAYRGRFSAVSLTTRAGGDTHRAERPRGRFLWDGGSLVIDGVREGDRDLGRVLEADLSHLDGSRLAARIDLPLLGGRVRGRLSGDFSGPGPGARADLEIEPIDPRPFLRFLGLPGFDARRVGGAVRGSLPGDREPSIEAVRGSFDLVIEGAGYAGRPSRSLTVRGHLGDGVLTARGEVEGGSAEFSARLDLVRERFLAGHFSLDEADLARARLSPAGLAAAGLLSGHGTISGPFGDPSFEVDLEIKGARWGRYAARRVALAAEGTPEEITVSKLSVTDGGDRLRAKGRVTTGEPVRFAGEAEVHLAEIAARRPLLPGSLPADLRGAIDLTVRADGTPGAPGATVLLTTRRPRAEGLSAAEARLEARVPDLSHLIVDSLSVRGLPGAPPLEIDGAEVARDGRAVEIRRALLRGPGGEATITGRVPLVPGGALAGEARFTGLKVADLAHALALPIPLLGRAEGTLRAGGTIERPELDLDLVVVRPGAVPPGRPRIEAERLTLDARCADGRARLRSLRITAPGYSVEARASAPLDLHHPEGLAHAPLSGRVAVRGLPLSAGGPIPGVPRAEGTVDLDLKLAGEPGHPRADGAITLLGKEIRVDGIRGPLVTDLRLGLRVSDLTPAGGDMAVDELTARVLDTPVRLRGSLALRGGDLSRPDLRLSVPEADLESLAKRLGLDLRARGKASARLRLTEGPRLAVEVTGEGLEAKDLDLGTLDLAATWEDGAFTVRRGRVGNAERYLVLEGRLPFALSLAPPSAAVSDTEPVDLHVVAHGLDLAAARLPDPEIRAAGALQADLDVGGSLTHPTWRGRIRLAGGRLRAPGAPPVEDLGASLALEPAGILVREITGSIGKGTFRLTGDVGLEDGRPRRLDLRLAARNLLIVRREGVRLRSDLDLALTGRSPRDLLLSGDATIRNFRSTGHTGLLRNYFENRGVLSTRPTVAPLPLTEDPYLGSVRLDVGVEAPPESIRVRDEFVDAVAEGALRVTGTLAVPRPDGRIHVARGKATLPTVTMEIEQAVVEFRKREPLRPYVTARAASRIGPWRVTAGITGAADDPRIRFSSDPALPEPDIVSLLATGATRSETGAGTLGSVAARFIGRQILSEISSGESDSTLSRLADRIEVDIDSSKEGTGGIPTLRATLRLLDHWLFLSGAQDDPANYGVDLIFRLTFR